MGAGQIGGFATLLDINFENAAGFAGTKATPAEAQWIVYFLSHAVLFCTGILLEPNVVLTPAVCITGERYKFEVFAGSHYFVETKGVSRTVENYCVHSAYNHTLRRKQCTMDNLAILVLNAQFFFNRIEDQATHKINRIRYGITEKEVSGEESIKCQIYGWGSRRNGFLIPLLLELYRVDVKVLPCHKCHQMWNYQNKYVCVEEPQCKNEKYGVLFPDDIGSALVCDGWLRGIMTSLIVDRPAGVGFLDMTKYHKFLTCAVDDSRDMSISETLKFVENTADDTPAGNNPVKF